MTVVSGLAVAFLALVHIGFPRFDRAAHRYLHLWLPLSAGVAIGYVFLYVMPELSDFTDEIIETQPDLSEFFQYRLFFIALLGLMTYLFIDRLGSGDDGLSHQARRIQGIGFCGYNVLLGYLLTALPRPGPVPVLLGVITLGFHFLGIDHQIRHTHRELFDRQLRWMLAASIGIGWAIGIATNLPHIYFATATAFIAGSIIVNVMVEELPDRRRSSLLFFVVGVSIFVAISLTARTLLPRLDH